MVSTSLPCTWMGTPNYTLLSGKKVAYISLHIMQGFLRGTDATFAKSHSGTSSTYGIGANGDIHQYVGEEHMAWADGSYTSNRQSISIEHEGGYPTAQNTDACVNASAQLCADIARRYGWNQLVHGQNIVLHREIYPYSHPSCPDGVENPLRWQEIINKANNLLNGNGDTDMPVKTDAFTMPDGSNVTVEYALQAIINNINSLYGQLATISAKIDADTTSVQLTDVQVDNLATQLKTTLGSEVVKSLAEKLGA